MPRSHTPRSAAIPVRGSGPRLRALVRVATLVSALWVVFGTSLAHAATWVPMCGEHAQTVIAPPISRGASSATLRAGACEERGPLELTSGAPERPKEPSAAHELVPRMPPVFHRLYSAPRARVSVATHASGERAAHRGAIERPPR